MPQQLLEKAQQKAPPVEESHEVREHLGQCGEEVMEDRDQVRELQSCQGPQNKEMKEL